MYSFDAGVARINKCVGNFISIALLSDVDDYNKIFSVHNGVWISPEEAIEFGNEIIRLAKEKIADRNIPDSKKLDSSNPEVEIK